MAILDDFEVKVKINGADAREYDDDDDEAVKSDKIVTKYIEAISRADFAIESKVSPRYVCEEDIVGFDICLDGDWVTADYHRRKNHSHIHGSRRIKGHAFKGSGKDTQRLKFQFADLDTRVSLPAKSPDGILLTIFWC